MYNVGDMVILNQNIEKGLPGHSGEVVEIVRKIKSPNYDYEVDLGNSINPVKETEIAELTDYEKGLIKYIYKGNRVMYIPSDEKVNITKVDFIHHQVAIKFDDYGSIVVGFDVLRELEEENVSLEESNLIETNEEIDKFTQIGLEIGKFTDMKNKQYGSSVDATNEMMKVLMERYTYDDDNYLMPKSLLQHILLQVRIMDKQNRIFNNPSGEGDSESPYKDLCGYSLIGIDMVAK